jgi:UDP-2,3-diacylglucosamine pyrophosphatase LpxH
MYKNRSNLTRRVRIGTSLLTLLWVLVSIRYPGVAQQVKSDQDLVFRFALFTDIHLNRNCNNCFEGLSHAMHSASNNNAEFIITAGDNIDIDAMSNPEQAIDLYQEYAQIMDKAAIRVYPAIGNHDRYFGPDPDGQLKDAGIWEKYIGPTYYSFDHKGWHFIVLNSVQTEEGKYPVVGEDQKNWLENDLKATHPDTPIVVTVHVPFLSLYYPALQGKYTAADTFLNFKEVWDMFEGYNLKLVLQGHMHLYEEIKVMGVQFITAGAVSASWWGGPYHGTEEGYLLVHINDQDFTWEYVDYGWVVPEKKSN